MQFLAEHYPLLALDTSSAEASLCLATEQKISERQLPSAVLPSESLLPALVEELKAFNLKIKDLTAIVIGLGPGSFTGLRVGLSTVKGLAVGANIPIIGISSFAILAKGIEKAKYVAPLLDARSGEIFAGLYRQEPFENCIADGAYKPEEFLKQLQKITSVENVEFAGDNSTLVQSFLQAINQPLKQAPIKSKFALELIQERLIQKDFDAVDLLVPRYLRLSEPEKKLLVATGKTIV